MDRRVVNFVRGIKRGAFAVAAGAIASLAIAPAPARAFPWSIDMYRGAAVQPLSEPPRDMPDGVLPVDGIHYNIHPGQPANLPGIDAEAPPPMKLEAMTVRMHNPLTETPENLQRGHGLFLANCSPCHGVTGIGNGSVVHLLQHKPANLMTGVSKNLPDGYIYGYIRNGGIWMPSYDDAMSSKARWQVVVYLRYLQHNYKDTEASASGDTGAPSAPAPSSGGSQPGGDSMGGMKMSH
jgi:hypothetical protein